MTLEIAENINSLVERSDRFYREGALHIKNAIALNKEAGLLLIQVKESLKHGEFTEWIKENCNFSDRYARYLMQIAKNWDKIIASWEQMKTETDFRFGHPLPCIKQAIALSASASEPKEEKPSPPPTTTYKIANPQHPRYGETVKEVSRLNQGDIIVCKTSAGEFPFLKNELIPETEQISLPPVVEIVDAEIEDNSEQLREAIALVIEYLDERQLQILLGQAIDLGKGSLPIDVISKFGKLAPQLVGK